MNQAYLLALHSVDGLGPIRLKKLLEFYRDPEVLWKVDTKELRNLGLSQRVVDNLTNSRSKLNVEKYAEKILKSGIKVSSIFDDNYPKRLKQIYDPPTIIYYKGEIKPEDFHAIAVVGTRKITGYGRTVTQQFTTDLAKAGLTIVSGLARGVDTIAHQSAIDTKGRTLAILGGGLNHIFPPENIKLADKIANGFGAIISEFPPDRSPHPGNFPARNRIIAGLSKAVLVTEAASDSGSLITARCAIEEGREVFAIPGPVTSALSKGPADLIKDGAKLVYSTEDIFDELGITKNTSPQNIDYSNLSKQEITILKCLETESKHIDELCRELQMYTPDVSACLLKLEIQGLVKSLGNGIYLSVALI